MGKYSFTVCCDSSNNYYSQSDAGATTSYIFDWTLVPDVKYNLTFSYMSDDVTTTLSPVMCIATDFTGVPNVFQANGSSASRRVGFLGMLLASKHGANGCYYADVSTNPPIQLQRPDNQQFTIYLTNALSRTPYATPAPGPYVLFLHFEECD